MKSLDVPVPTWLAAKSSQDSSQVPSHTLYLLFRSAKPNACPFHIPAYSFSIVSILTLTYIPPFAQLPFSQYCEPQKLLQLENWIYSLSLSYVANHRLCSFFCLTVTIKSFVKSWKISKGKKVEDGPEFWRGEKSNFTFLGEREEVGKTVLSFSSGLEGDELSRLLSFPLIHNRDIIFLFRRIMYFK